MSHRFRIVVFAGVLWGISTASIVHADPITVTAGTAFIDFDGPSFIGISGTRGFQLSAFTTPIPGSAERICVDGCVPGTTVDMRTVFGRHTAWRVALDGVLFVDVTPGEAQGGLGLEVSGPLQFEALPIVLPPVDPDWFPGQGVDFVSPFSLMGHVSAFARDDPDRQLFRADLVGQGRARLSLVAWGDGYTGPRYTYEFSAANPVPEPSTLFLIGTGAAVLLARRAKRWRASGGRRDFMGVPTFTPRRGSAPAVAGGLAAGMEQQDPF
jgi:hypothetical protein